MLPESQDNIRPSRSGCEPLIGPSSTVGLRLLSQIQMDLFHDHECICPSGSKFAPLTGNLCPPSRTSSRFPLLFQIRKVWSSDQDKIRSSGNRSAPLTPSVCPTSTERGSPLLFHRRRVLSLEHDSICKIRSKLDTDSDLNWTPIPEKVGQSFRF